MISGTDKAIALRSLSVMLNSDINLHSAFSILAEQAAVPAVGDCCQRVVKALTSGHALPKAMETAPELFGRFDQKLAEVGMLSGQLATAMTMAADHYERSEKNRSQVWAALTYPLITLGICLILVVVVPPFVFRSLFEMLRSADVELPWLSRAVMAFSESVQNPWVWLVVLSLGALVWKGISLQLRHRSTRLKLSKLLVELPLIGDFVRTQTLTYFVNALSALVSTGITLHRALPLAAEASRSLALEDATKKATEEILNGAPLVESLQSSEYFPSLFVLSISAGEESGDLVKALQNTARLYELDLESRTEGVLSLLSPMVTFLLGMIVGVVNLAVLLPLVELMKKL